MVTISHVVSKLIDENIYYVLHVGHCNKQGEWKNQHMLVTDKDLSSLNVLVRKSLFFAATVPKQGFVNASELVNSSKVSGITYA
ncbi:MAG: hypothetical protein KAS76_02735 [Thermoplasmatales archaeon]|nr:hypothetical protein [Thermoplasmatales archaeon]